jgi:glycosyltransferase involved in cell wall biosynthesis
VIDVLLVSPRLRSSDPRYGGDHAYTDVLLAHPPPAVRFHHYEDALAAGRMRRIPWLYRIGPRLARWGLLPPDLWAEYLEADFVPDVVHVVSFSAVVRLPAPAPLVIGTSTGSTSDLCLYRGWSERRARRRRRAKRLYLRLIGAHDSSLRPELAARVLVWSEFARRLHLEEGYVHPERIQVLRPGLPPGDEGGAAGEAREGVTLLFVGRDFERKNGPLLLEAFRNVRARHPALRLIVVGEGGRGQPLAEEGVVQYPSLRREELLTRVYPRADALVLPSRAEGFGFVLLEALSHGIPVIAPRAFAIPEIVTDGRSGILLDPAALATELRACLERVASEPETLRSMRPSCRADFAERFTITRHNGGLGAVYDAVV